MTFKLTKQTAGGMWLFESDEAAPVARPVALLHGRKPAGRLLETIGRLDAPRFVGQLDRKFPIGTEFEPAKFDDSRRR